jgi:hypothetical protein
MIEADDVGAGFKPAPACVAGNIILIFDEVFYPPYSSCRFALFFSSKPVHLGEGKMSRIATSKTDRVEDDHREVVLYDGI